MEKSKISILPPKRIQPQVSLLQKPPIQGNHSPTIPRTNPPSQENSNSSNEIDFLLVTALNDPTHRFFILKVDLELTHFLKDHHSTTLEFPPLPSFQRLLIHRMASFFFLGHNVVGHQNATKRSVVLHKLSNSRIPILRINDLIPQEEPVKKNVKILIRSRPKKEESKPEEPKKSPVSIAVNPRRVRKPVIISEPNTSESGEEEIVLSAEASKKLSKREEEYAKARARIFNQPYSEENDLFEDTATEIQNETTNLTIDNITPPKDNILSSNENQDEKVGATVKETKIVNQTEPPNSQSDNYPVAYSAEKAIAFEPSSHSNIRPFSESSTSGPNSFPTPNSFHSYNSIGNYPGPGAIYPPHGNMAPFHQNFPPQPMHHPGYPPFPYDPRSFQPQYAPPFYSPQFAGNMHNFPRTKQLLYNYSDVQPGSPVTPEANIPGHILELSHIKAHPKSEEFQNMGATLKILSKKGPAVAIFKSKEIAEQTLQNQDNPNFSLKPWSGRIRQ